MSDSQYTSLEHKIDKLIKLCHQLHKENSALLKKESDWNIERSELTQKNEHAVKQIKEMIDRLKKLEKHS
ncbi:MAG: TIGR02449 family protein [Pseudomonadota bacterium]